MSERGLDDVAVSMIVSIQSRWDQANRMPETDEYRRGWREALMGLQNSREADELREALRDAGWVLPSRSWRSPPVADPPPALGAQGEGSDGR